VEWDTDPDVYEVVQFSTDANDVDEIQELTSTASDLPEIPSVRTTANKYQTLGGSFTLELEIEGSIQTSGLISHAALSQAAGDRSTMQSIIAAMKNINSLVSVSREGPDDEGGYEWKITFPSAWANAPGPKLPDRHRG
jgi:hypothetical protein